MVKAVLCVFIFKYTCKYVHVVPFHFPIVTFSFITKECYFSGKFAKDGIFSLTCKHKSNL